MVCVSLRRLLIPARDVFSRMSYGKIDLVIRSRDVRFTLPLLIAWLLGMNFAPQAGATYVYVERVPLVHKGDKIEVIGRASREAQRDSISQSIRLATLTDPFLFYASEIICVPEHQTITPIWTLLGVETRIQSDTVSRPSTLEIDKAAGGLAPVSYLRLQPLPTRSFETLPWLSLLDPTCSAPNAYQSLRAWYGIEDYHVIVAKEWPFLRVWIDREPYSLRITRCID
jgi:hypothetical protein